LPIRSPESTCLGYYSRASAANATLAEDDTRRHARFRSDAPRASSVCGVRSLAHT
jgi:hypothetical protein